MRGKKPLLFGHVLHEAPPGLVGEGLEQFLLPSVGVAAAVTDVQEARGDDGETILQVRNS